MVTGVECAGLVLAVLPLFVETAKVYARGVDSIQNVALQSRRDEKLQEFYEDFWWEIALLHRQIRDIVGLLRYLSDERKIELATVMHLEDWNQEADITEALQDFFRSDDDLNVFLTVMSKILQLLAQLVKDSTIQLSRADIDGSVMYEKLKDFSADRASAQTSSSLKERIRFWKREKDRSTCLKNLRTWNKRLGRLTDDACREPTVKKALPSSQNLSSSQFRRFSERLYTALSKSWSCNCGERHEAKFCLKSHGSSSKEKDESEIDFDLLFSASANQSNQRSWQESIVLFRSKRETTKEDRKVLQKVCDAIQEINSTSHCLNLLVEDSEGEQTLWQLRSRPKRVQFLQSTPAVSLQTLLFRKPRFSLIVKRRLALILAESFLQLHGSPWLSQEWNKGHISFFYVTADMLDYQRPYLSTSFDDGKTDIEVPDMNRFHRNPSILALGILLIEIHTEKPIESYRTAADLSNGQEVNANTDWTVADRVVKGLEDCSVGYKDAIQACLDTPWIPAGQQVSLEDPVTRTGLYNDVVQPLKDELIFLFKEKI